MFEFLRRQPARESRRWPGVSSPRAGDGILAAAALRAHAPLPAIVLAQADLEPSRLGRSTQPTTASDRTRLGHGPRGTAYRSSDPISCLRTSRNLQRRSTHRAQPNETPTAFAAARRRTLTQLHRETERTYRCIQSSVASFFAFRVPSAIPPTRLPPLRREGQPPV